LPEIFSWQPVTKRKYIFITRVFIYLHIGERGVEYILGPLGTAATPGLLYLPRVIVRTKKLVE
jgi:hypothetical protein